jgi:hypothetical protein
VSIIERVLRNTPAEGSGPTTEADSRTALLKSGFINAPFIALDKRAGCPFYYMHEF